jgi:coenzyme F420 hydrogenase subunit beta
MTLQLVEPPGFGSPPATGEPLVSDPPNPEDRTNPDDPAADVRDEVRAASGVPEHIDKIWFHKTASAVIDAERCIGCGGCIAACPSRSIAVAEDGRPTLVRMCTGCSACWDFCPLAGLRTESLLAGGESASGTVLAAHSTRAEPAVPGAQDGGAVTALLCELLRRGEIDGVLLTSRTTGLAGEARIVTSVEEVQGSAGSVYHQPYPLAKLAGRLPEGVGRLAFVGTPCQVSVLRALQRFPWRYRESWEGAVVLAIALFCSRSFDPERLRSSLVANGADPSEARAVRVEGGALTAKDGNGSELCRVPVRSVRSAALRGCEECSDFTGIGADLSMGSLGSPTGYTTVLVRTEVGNRAWSAAREALSSGPAPDFRQVEAFADRNRRRARKSSPSDGNGGTGPWTSYSEHLLAHGGTDRAPVATAPFRSQHYDLTC